MEAMRTRRRARNARRASPSAAYAAARRRPPLTPPPPPPRPPRRFRGLFWKFARVGERLSPWVALACLGMAFSILFQ
jgi:hypothetical protein